MKCRDEIKEDFSQQSAFHLSSLAFEKPWGWIQMILFTEAALATNKEEMMACSYPVTPNCH
jgi:hypothetical protein